MKTKHSFYAMCFAVATMAPLQAAAISSDLLEMSEQLDEIEKQDFQTAIERATSCTRMRDFPCAEAELAKAAKTANGRQDQRTLLAARQNIANEKAQIAKEERLRAEQDERLRVAEVAQAERRRQQEAEESRSSGFQWEKALIGLGTGAALGGGMSSEAKREYVTGVIADSMPGQEGFANTAARVNAYVAEQKTRQGIADQQFRDRQAQKMQDEAANNERLLQAASDSRQPYGGQQPGGQAQVDKAKFAATPREAERERDRAQRVAEARERDEADARERRAAEESRAQQEREQKRKAEERREQELRDSNERKRAAAAEEAKRKTEAAAAKAAEQKAKNDYLTAMKNGIRLTAIKCLDGEGKYYATGSMPKMKQTVSCIDVYYRAYCPGSVAYSSGVASNFIGMGGCYGDTYQISPKPGCPVEQVRIEVTDVQPGCN